MHFKIIEEKPPYQPLQSSPPDYGQVAGLRAGFPDDAKASVILESTATKAMFSHIGWGDLHRADNRVEQGGILVGEVYKDPAKGTLVSIAKFAIPAKLTKGSATYLQITSEIWGEMIKQLDYLNDHVASGTLVIMGWYHTHPNSLGVFFSGTDRSTQSRFFRQDWQIGVVLNPHKKIWTAFYGEESHPTGGIILDPESNPIVAEDLTEQPVKEESCKEGSAIVESSDSPEIVTQGVEEDSLSETSAVSVFSDGDESELKHFKEISKHPLRVSRVVGVLMATLFFASGFGLGIYCERIGLIQFESSALPKPSNEEEMEVEMENPLPPPEKQKEDASPSPEDEPESEESPKIVPPDSE